MTSVVTRTDEAFVVWILETSKNSWKEQAENEEKGQAKDKEIGQMSDDEDDDENDENEKAKSRFGSEIGMKTFEKCVQLVQNTRASPHRNDWDKQLQIHMKDHFKKNKKVIEKPKTNKKRKYIKNFDAMVDDF